MIGRTVFSIAVILVAAQTARWTALAPDPAEDFHPSWSPDGQRLVFDSRRDGGVWQIFMINPNGTIAQLTRGPATNDHPRWMTDGRIIYESGSDGNEDIWVMAPDGSARQRLTSQPGTDGAAFPTVDGRSVAFLSKRTGNWDVFVMRSDGTNVQRLTSNPGDDFFGAWSPDGTSMVIQSRIGSSWDIVRIDLATGRSTQLTKDSMDDEGPSWSPDGTRIAFQSNRDGQVDLYSINTDGTGLVRLTRSREDDGEVAWAPIGNRLAYRCGAVATGDLCLINGDGSGPVRLTSTPGRETVPSWSPDGGSLVFVADQGDNLDIFSIPVPGGRPRGNPAIRPDSAVTPPRLLLRFPDRTPPTRSSNLPTRDAFSVRGQPSPQAVQGDQVAAPRQDPLFPDGGLL